jgi:hypothetical protein
MHRCDRYEQWCTAKSLRKISDAAVTALGRNCPGLVELNISFMRLVRGMNHVLSLPFLDKSRQAVNAIVRITTHRLRVGPLRVNDTTQISCFAHMSRYVLCRFRRYLGHTICCDSVGGQVGTTEGSARKRR